MRGGVLTSRVNDVVDSGFLFVTHREGVFRYLCRVVGHRDARDLTQEVFLRVSRGPVPDAPDGAQRAWVFQIARNLALNHLRDTRRRPLMVELIDSSRPATQETTTALHQALNTLAALDRDVFLMREMAGLNYEEIALACSITTGAVRARLYRGRQQLRELLRPLPGALNCDVRLYDRQRQQS